MKKLLLVTDPNTINAALEVWYIQNRIAGGLPFTLLQDTASLQDAVVIYLELVGADINYIQALKNRGNKVMLFQMGDEYGKKSRDAYDLCDGFIKNYCFDEIFETLRWKNKSFWSPNGFKSGIGPRDPRKLKPTTDRTYLSSFMGWLSNSGSYHDERNQFQAQIEHCQPHLFVNPSQGFSGGFQVGLYSTVLESSIFCPCPAGNSPETIRLYDVLEMGGIPISLRHDFLESPFALKGVPFPVLDRWEDLPNFLAQQQAIRERQPEQLLALQRTCIEWWQLRQSEIIGRIDRFIFDLRTQP